MYSAPKDVTPSNDDSNGHERRHQQRVLAVLGLVLVAVLVRAYVPVWFTVPNLAKQHTSSAGDPNRAMDSKLQALPGVGPDLISAMGVAGDSEELKRTSYKVTESTGPLNINTATAAELEALPRIGPVLAEAIVATRMIKPFTSVDDLRRVRGIGAKTLESLRPFVKVD
jgi:competence ComEA-like helix-hairpin-helix protein